MNGAGIVLDTEQCRNRNHPIPNVPVLTFYPRLRKLLPFIVRLANRFRPHLGAGILKLTPNVVVKYGKSVHLSEAEAMRFVAANTDVPVPRILDAFECDKGVRYILMDCVKGVSLRVAWRTMTDVERDRILLELKGYLDHLREVRPPQPHIVAAVDYSSCHDVRISADAFGPFENHDEFHRFLRWGQDENSTIPGLAEICHAHKSKQYRTVLTHADLAPRNIMVYKGKVTGILDWETAGWFPEYWEYTRAWESLWDASELRPRLNEILDVYKSELEMEQNRLPLLE